MSQSEQPATTESGASSGNNVSNQSKYQNTSPTSLNHHEQHKPASNTLAKDQVDEQQPQVTAEASKLLTQPFHTMAMHNFGPNSHHQQQQNDQKQQQSQHSKQVAGDNSSSRQGNQNNNNNNNDTSDSQATSINDNQPNISTSPPSAGPLNGARQLQSQQQQQQHGSSLQGQTSISNINNNLQASFASRVDQIIRSTLNDTPHAQIPKSHPTKGNNMPSPSSAGSSSLASSMIFNNPVSSLAAISSAHSHHLSTTSLPSSSIAGLTTAAALSQLDSFYGGSSAAAAAALSAVSYGDTLKNNNNNNNSNLLAKTSAHSASHSALAAAAALQSLNQSHLQRSHHQQQHQPPPPPSLSLPPQQQQQQQPSHSQQTSCANVTVARPPSNTLVPQAAHATSNSNVYMPKLGITSTTSSDHHNHNHLASLSGQQQQQQQHSDNLADLAARFQVNSNNNNNTNTNKNNMPFLSSIRPPVSWQDQVSHANAATTAGAGAAGNTSAGAPRWQPPPIPPPPSHHGNINPSLQQHPFNAIGSTNMPIGLNISNSNNMIGPEGDNPSRLNRNSNTDRRNTPQNIAYNLDDLKNLTNNNNNNSSGPGGFPLGVPPNSSTKQNPPWLDANFKSPYSLAEAAARLQSQQQQQQQRNSGNGGGSTSDQQQQQQQQLDRNTERLTLFAYNLMSTCLPGTNKPKKLVQLDDEIRHSIYSGEFYTRFENIALGILTNQVMLPGFSIIDYIRRDKFAFHEADKIDNIHRKLGESNFLCLNELAQQRPFLHPSLTKQLPLDSSINPNPFGSAIHPSLTMTPSQQHQLQQQALKNSQFPFLPPLPSRSDLLGLDKSGRSSQSPSDINARSHPQNMPKLHSAHSSPQSNLHGPPDALMMAQQQHQNQLHQNNPHLLPSMGGAARNSHNSSIHANRSSPFQTPLSVGPPPVPRPPRSHSTIGGLGIGSSFFDHHHHHPHPHHTSPFGSPALQQQPPAAHQNSSRPNLANLASDLTAAHSGSVPVSAHMSSKIPQSSRLPDNISLPRKVPPPGPPPFKPGKSYPQPGDATSGGRFDVDPVTGLNARQQQELAASRDFMNKRSTTPQSMMGNVGGHGPSGMVDPHFASRSPFNQQPQFYGNQLVGMNDPTLKANFGPNVPMSSSMPPPMVDFHKQNLIDPSKSMVGLPPNLNVSSANDAQLKQYSAIMAAYQQQQQQQLMTSDRSPNSNPMNGPPPFQMGPGSQQVPQAYQMSSDQMRSDMFQNQQQQLGLQPNQISPKQGTQRSIITGSGASAPKKGKKSKYSPPSSAQPASDGRPLNLGGTDMTTKACESESQQNATNFSTSDQQNKASIDLSQTDSQQQQQVSLDLRPASGRAVVANVGQFAGASETSADQQQQQAQKCAQTNDMVADFIARGDEMPKNVDAIADFNHQTTQDRKGQSNIASNSSIVNSNQVIVSNYSNAQRNINLKENDIAAEALKQHNKQSETSQTTSNIETPASDSSAPSKYQKLFTKKAWLRNYDQEDQSRASSAIIETPTTTTTTTTTTTSPEESNEANNMTLKTKNEVKAEKIEEGEQKDVKPAIKMNGNKTNKTNASKLESRKRIKVKKETSAARQGRITGGGSKSADNDSEETNASTSELDDTDETDSLKSSNEKKLRRMPRRKVKLNSDKESDQPGSPKATKPLKEVGRKKDKKQKVNAEVGGKRKFNSDGSVKQKQKKLKQDILTNNNSNPATTTTSKSGEKLDKTNSAPTTPAKSKKQKGDKFLQTVPCWEFEPKSIRCLECRRFRHSNTKGDKVVQTKQSRNNWDDFCRFFEFRKLRYNKAGHIVVAGFSDLSDAKDSDKRLWLPNGNETPKNINFDVATYIISNVGDQFCQLVLQERSVQDDYNSSLDSDKEHDEEDEAGEVNSEAKRITWKRAVNGLRELCDVCSTTLFNNHYVCERCGFVVCIDCYGSRAKNQNGDDNDDASSDNKSSLEKESPNKVSNASENGDEQAANNTSKRNKRDSHGWIYCAKNEEHTIDQLILTQIIAGDCLEEVWRLLHFTRDTLKLGQCSCKKVAHVDGKPTTNLTITEIKKEQGELNVGEPPCKQVESAVEGEDPEGSHSTLKGLLLATRTNSPTNNPAVGCDEKNTCSEEDKSAKLNGNDHNGNKSTLTELENNNKVFDFSNEDDSQDDSKQVSAAIEECIASLASKTNQPSEMQVDVPFSQFVSDKSIAKVNSTHSSLYGGDLLVLSQPRHKDNLQLFRDHWRHGKPVIVRGIHELMDIESWSPRFFAKQFGDYRSDLVDCRNGEIHRTSMKKYWEGFEPSSSVKKKPKEDCVPAHIPAASNEEPSAISTSYYSGSALWRLKDWPPGQDFNEILPKHYEDFMNNLPLKSYTTRTGKLNLACRLPKEMLKPDLGPKMYSAYGTTKFPERGTTNLHLDISDAINVMVYVSGASALLSGSTDYKEVYENTIEECCVDADMKAQIRDQKLIPGALWHIFKPSDAPKMREFLNKVSDERKISMLKRNDPIHDQIWYLDQTLLDRLHEEYGVKSYAILQCMGDAILIPAGAPHQVKNLQNCIKVANDFVSPENVPYCMQLTNEFRSLPETHINQEDKLQIKNILYHSVKESLQYIKLCKTGQIGDYPEDDEWENIQIKLDKWVENNARKE